MYVVVGNTEGYPTRIGPAKFYKRGSQEKTLPYGRSFSCFPAPVNRARVLTGRSMVSVCRAQYPAFGFLLPAVFIAYRNEADQF